MLIAIIPARGGSKRIPKKNIKLFSGNPLISYAIFAARDSGLFDRIIVSTDSKEIAEISLNYGAEVPFLRPPELSDDFTPTTPVVRHALEWINNNGVIGEYICCIYPNPFVTAKNVRKGLELIKRDNAMSLMPVVSFPFPIYRSVEMSETRRIKPAFEDKWGMRSQDLPELYHDAGQFYWWKCEAVLDSTDAVDQILKDCTTMILPRHLTQDLDSLEDWTVAEKLYESFINDEGCN